MNSISHNNKELLHKVITLSYTQLILSKLILSKLILILSKLMYFLRASF